MRTEATSAKTSASTDASPANASDIAGNKSASDSNDMPVPSQATPKDSTPTGSLVPSEQAPPTPSIASVQELALSSQLVLFAFAIVLVEAVVIKVTSIPSDGAIRLITVTLILISILYLTTAGYSSQQITAATGLLGTIAGYLLGRSSGRDNQTPITPTS